MHFRKVWGNIGPVLITSLICFFFQLLISFKGKGMLMDCKIYSYYFLLLLFCILSQYVICRLYICPFPHKKQQYRKYGDETCFINYMWNHHYSGKLAYINISRFTVILYILVCILTNDTLKMLTEAILTVLSHF